MTTISIVFFVSQYKVGRFGGLFYIMKLTLGRFGRQRKEYNDKKFFLKRMDFYEIQDIVGISSVKKNYLLKKKMLYYSEFNRPFALYYVKKN